ncbi:2-dehydro-3-deoxygalactonokinase [Isoptericola sp. BMS4]|uniref:2-dehydro-3-deoxygalactonokinase n=1 Tax=Isoptericola sp. BMS4 TaxID=2527875 RepID=UPI0014221B13|nr:2-dehydro-3-deoxygalactonokinase [Isoptericola sp. BMS4]
MADDVHPRGAALVALDWGTTTFRGWLLDRDGRVLDEVRSPDGSLRTSAGARTAGERAAAFAGTFARRCGHWFGTHPGLPVVCAGMAGSDHGWADAGYLDVPADLGDLADGLVALPVDASADGAADVAGGVVHLVPGLRVTGPDPDVLRGEEVQLLGAVAGGADPPRAVVLPGTHTKWVRLDGARVTGFSTAMTGEVYGLLLRDSVLSRLADGSPGDAPSPAFDRALDVEAERGDDAGLLTLLFGARTRVQAGRLAPSDVADHLSGLLVGSEVRHALRTAPADEVAVGGEGPVVARYRRALERHGAAVRALDGDVAVRGLWHVALGAGLVPAPPAARTPAAPHPEDQP